MIFSVLMQTKMFKTVLMKYLILQKKIVTYVETDLGVCFFFQRVVN